MGAGCCVRIDPKNNNVLVRQQMEKENALKELSIYYKANKNFLNLKVRVIFKKICKTGKYESDLLNLSFVSFSKSRVEYLLQLLPYLENLRVLKLWKSGLASEGIKIISRDLGMLYGLEVLSLEDNSIGADGCMYLSSTLEKLRKLREIWLHINDIGPIGAICISDILSNLPDLERLGLDENAIENKGAIKIMNSVKGLKNLKMLGLAITLSAKTHVF